MLRDCVFFVLSVFLVRLVILRRGSSGGIVSCLSFADHFSLDAGGRTTIGLFNLSRVDSRGETGLQFYCANVDAETMMSRAQVPSDEGWFVRYLCEYAEPQGQLYPFVTSLRPRRFDSNAVLSEQSRRGKRRVESQVKAYEGRATVAPRMTAYPAGRIETSRDSSYNDRRVGNARGDNGRKSERAVETDSLIHVSLSLYNTNALP
jgi:hypothetical protein